MSVKHNNTKCKTYNMTEGLHVSTLTESSSGPHDIDPYKELLCNVGSLSLTITVVNDNQSE